MTEVRNFPFIMVTNLRSNYWIFKTKSALYFLHLCENSLDSWTRELWNEKSYLIPVLSLNKLHIFLQNTKVNISNLMSHYNHKINYICIRISKGRILSNANQLLLSFPLRSWKLIRSHKKERRKVAISQSALHYHDIS